MVRSSRGVARPKIRFPILTSPGSGDSFWFKLNSGTIATATIQQEALRRKYVIVQCWDYGMLATIKAANPSCMVIAYKDSSSTGPSTATGSVDNVDISCGLGWNEANNLASSGSDYFLKSVATGSRIEYANYPGSWQMDVSQAGYRTRWADNVIANLQLRGFDGVFIDNLLFWADQYGTIGTAYTTDAATRAAYTGFLQAVFPRLHSAGLIAIGNTNGAYAAGTSWDDYHTYLDGGLDESWVTFSDDETNNWVWNWPAGDGWSKRVAEIATNESRGKLALVQAKYTVGNTTAFRYTYATYLMGMGGRSGYSELQQFDGYLNPSPWHAEYDWDLGPPSGAYFAVSGFTNVFRRNFTNGCVVVNANQPGTAALNISLGATFLNESGASVTSVSLAGVRGTILRT